MSDKSTIEWTDATWNPVTGCTQISAGCDHCYAKVLSERLQRMGVAKYRKGFEVVLHPAVLQHPLKWETPRRIFVNSMSDLFHAQVPGDFVAQVWEVMSRCPQHIFQILTKRPERMARWTALHPTPPNVWLGTSVENAQVLRRVEYLRQCNGQVRFLSCEPLIGPLTDLELRDIHWVIVGGESGHGYRPINAEWVRQIRDKCLRDNVPFFFKQWGGRTPKSGGRLLDEMTWDQLPGGKATSMAWWSLPALAD